MRKAIAIMSAGSPFAAGAALLGRLTHWVHRIGERDGGEAILLGVLHDLRIDEEHDRHVTLLAGAQLLLAEAETVDLGEIGSCRGRRDVIGGYPDRVAGRLIDHPIIDR